MHKIITTIVALFLAAPAVAVAQIDPQNFPANSVYGRIGVPGNSGFGEAIPFAQLGAQLLGGPITNRLTFNYTPVFNNGLAVSALFANIPSVTVPTNGNYSEIRLSQAGGGNNTFMIGPGGTVASIYSSPEALSGSDPTSNLYGAVLHCTNDGPGTCKGVHLAA